jgi:cardiolipin synthase
MEKSSGTYTESFMTLANQITLLRIILIPVFIITLIEGSPYWPVIIFTFTVLTDAIDGFVARKRNEKTKLGSFLDPLADKMLMFASFITLVYLKVVPLWVFVVTISRDVVILAGWLIIYFITDSLEIKPRLLGKITTIVQMSTIWFILLGVQAPLQTSLLYLTAAVTAISGIDYIIVGSKKVGQHS